MAITASSLKVGDVCMWTENGFEKVEPDRKPAADMLKEQEPDTRISVNGLTDLARTGAVYGAYLLKDSATSPAYADIYAAIAMICAAVDVLEHLQDELV